MQNLDKNKTLQNFFDTLGDYFQKYVNPSKPTTDMAPPPVTLTPEERYRQGCQAESHNQYLNAYRLFYFAAQQNHVPSMLKVAEYCLKGIECKINIDRAYQWFVKAIFSPDSPERQEWLDRSKVLQKCGELAFIGELLTTTPGIDPNYIQDGIHCLLTLVEDETLRKATLVLNHIPSPEDPDQDDYAWFCAVTKGSAWVFAANLLAEFCYNGKIIKKDGSEFPIPLQSQINAKCYLDETQIEMLSSGYRETEKQYVETSQFMFELSKLLELSNDYELYQNKNQSLRWIRRAAECHNPEALNRLGIINDRGLFGLPADKNKAFQYFLEAAEIGFSVAQINVACCYFNGEGTRANPAKALEWSEKAAEQGETSAMLLLADAYEDGEIVEQSDEKAFYWYKKAADKNHAGACNRLAYYYCNGIAVPLSNETALQYLLKAASGEPDHPAVLDAQCQLGSFYEMGLGMPQPDLKKAREWFETAAENGCDKAQNRLGLAYTIGGLGLETDYRKAIEYFKQAAEQDNPLALYNLAIIYDDDEDAPGIYKDQALAFEYMKRAADLGEPNAQYVLGLYYQDARGTEQNMEEAFNCFTMSVEQAHIPAFFALASCYLNGEGCEKNEAKAIELYTEAAQLAHKKGKSDAEGDAYCNLSSFYYKKYNDNPGNTETLAKYNEYLRKAADLGNLEATCKLGISYFNGFGLEEDKEHGLQLIRKASENGDQLATILLKDLEKGAYSHIEICHGRPNNSEINDDSFFLKLQSLGYNPEDLDSFISLIPDNNSENPQESDDNSATDRHLAEHSDDTPTLQTSDLTQTDSPAQTEGQQEIELTIPKELLTAAENGDEAAVFEYKTSNPEIYTTFLTKYGFSGLAHLKSTAFLEDCFELHQKNPQKISLNDAGKPHPVLHSFYMAENVEGLEWLLAHGANIETRDSEGYSPLHRAILDEDVEAMSFFIDHGANIHTTNNSGESAYMTVISLATEHNNIELLSLIRSKL